MDKFEMINYLKMMRDIEKEMQEFCINDAELRQSKKLIRAYNTIIDEIKAIIKVVKKYKEVKK